MFSYKKLEFKRRIEFGFHLLIVKTRNFHPVKLTESKLLVSNTKSYRLISLGKTYRQAIQLSSPAAVMNVLHSSVKRQNNKSPKIANS